MGYIHYGHTEFQPERLTGVKNRSPWGEVKPDPKTAIWASPEDAETGWKDWCEREDFRTYALETHFTFTLTDDARILTISSEKTLHHLQPFLIENPVWHPEYNLDISKVIEEAKRTGTGQTLLLDFEKMSKAGFDGMEISISDYPQLYWFLYGWDVDSICIWNPDVIKMTGSSDEMVQHMINVEVRV